jgi:DNA-directed RNA polymerase subunit omega
MIYPSADKLDAMESKYALVIVAAKRARQVKDGARRLTDSRSGNALTVALEEIASGAIIPVHVGEPEKLPTTAPATPVLGGLVSTALDDDDGLHESTAAEISSLLATPEELAGFESDLHEDEDDELTLDEPADSHPFGIEAPGDDLADVHDEAADEEDLESPDSEQE